MNRAYDPRPRRPSRLAFDVSRIVVDVGVLLVLGAMSLPFVTGEDFRQRALAGDGLVALLLVAPIFVMTVLPDQSRPLPRPLALASLLLAGAALPYTVVKYLDASTLAGTVQGSVGMGARVLVIGAFTVLGGLVLGLVRARLQPAAEAAGADDLPDRGPGSAPIRPLCPALPSPPAPRPHGARPLPGPPEPRCPNRRPPAPSPAGSAPGRPIPRPRRLSPPRPPDAPRCPPRRPPTAVAPRPRPGGPRHRAHPPGAAAGAALVARRPR